MELALVGGPEDEGAPYAGKVVVLFNANAQAARMGENLEAVLRECGLASAIVEAASEEAARQGAAAVAGVGGDIGR